MKVPLPSLLLRQQEITLIHHQGIICGVAFARFSLRRIVYTTQSSLLGALHMMPC
jgi:hypothetical protein